VLKRQLKVQSVVLLALVLFSVWNANLFLAGVWHPVATVVPEWLQFLVRGCVVPGLLLLTGLLTPLTDDPVHALNAASLQDLRTLLKAHHADMRRRITHLRRHLGDLTPVVVAYAADLGELDIARRLRLLTKGLAEAEAALESGGCVDDAAERNVVPMSPVGGPVGEPFREALSHTPIPLRRKRTAEEARADAEIAMRNLLARDPNTPRPELMKQAKASLIDVDYWRPIILREMGVHTKHTKRRKAS
jgi:hypothetical protein